MGLCRDKSVTFLKNLGYNVVRLPKADIKPLDLLGIRKDDPRILGTLKATQGTSLPQVKKDTVVANVNGKSSSKLNLELGLNILGNVINAMGGNLDLTGSWTNAKTVTFEYANVTEDSVVPMDLSNVIANSDAQLSNPILNEYLFGSGKLFILTAVLKSTSIKVNFERSNGIGADLKVPVIQQMVGAKIKVTSETTANHVVTFQGQSPLVFAFQCFEVIVDDGIYRLSSSKPGSTFMSLDDGSVQSALLVEDGLVDL